MSNSSNYETDFHAWAMEQSRLLRAGRLAEADVLNIAEEIESMGRSEKRELTSRLAVLLTHLLKWQIQPALRSNSWQLTIREHRRRIDRHLQENPSLRASVDPTIVVAYGDALLEAQRETGLAQSAFPEQCPWTSAAILADGFLPE